MTTLLPPQTLASAASISLNDWVHPSLAAVATHLAGRGDECRVEARGHVLHAVTMHYNMRQSVGGLAMMGGMISLPVGFFFPPMLGRKRFLAPTFQPFV